MHAEAAIGTGIDHGADAAILVAGDGRQVDLHQGAADASVAQASANVVALIDIAQLKAMTVAVQGVQGEGQGDFGVDVVGAVVEHPHRLFALRQGCQCLQPAGLQGLGA
ncbi:hypothetical protein D3C77_591740 [compost metagenome]